MKTMDLAFSPCPNDTFIFHAMLHGLVNTKGYAFRSLISDVEDLNRQAMQGASAFTKISYHAYLLLKDNYSLLRAGSALGFGCGPLLVARHKLGDLRDLHIAVPGKYTTASLLFHLWNSDRVRISEARFDRIMPGVASGEFDAGIIIHEGRFVYPRYNLIKIIDLGEWWESETGLPIPLGCIAVRNDAADASQREELASILRSSVEYGRRHPEASRYYIKIHAQEMDDDVIAEHIRLYVNEFTLDLGDMGIKAVETLEEKARWKKII